MTPRAESVRVRALNEKGEPVEIDARGWYVRILQHEIDHVHGHLYLDRMMPRTFMTTANHQRLWSRHAADKVCAELGCAIR